MKKWVQGKEQMWACGTSNLPEYNDIIQDKSGVNWLVIINGGFYLYDTETKGVHPELQDAPWHVLAHWFNES